MVIGFNDIPSDIRVPFVFVEFDSSRAQQGASIQRYRVLLIGNRLASGTKPEKQIDLITKPDQARNFYGDGSILHSQVKSYFKNNKVTEMRCISLDDDGAAIAASGSYEVLTVPTADGTLSLMIGGTRYRIAVLEGDTEAEIIVKLIAEIETDSSRLVSVAINGGNADQMDIVARNKAEVCNEIDIRENYFDGEELPAGMTSAIIAMAGGTANPDIAGVFAVIGETQYNIISMPYTDTSNLDLMETELEDRWGPIRQNDGAAIMAKKDTVGALSTYGNALNSRQETTIGMTGPTPSWEWSAAVAARVALAGQIDPARPFQTLELIDIKAPNDAEDFTLAERDILLHDGIATFNADAAGTVRIERVITHFQLNEFGAESVAFLDLNTKLTLSFMRFDFRTQILNAFPREKLASDGNKFAPGQRIVTPRIAKAKAVAIFKIWQEDLAIAEGLEQFKRDLIVERDVTVNRLNYLLPPDLVNQMRVHGVQIRFLL